MEPKRLVDRWQRKALRAQTASLNLYWETADMINTARGCWRLRQNVQTGYERSAPMNTVGYVCVHL